LKKLRESESGETVTRTSSGSSPELENLSLGNKEDPSTIKPEDLAELEAFLNEAQKESEELPSKSYIQMIA
jgi:hypothetical protein